MSTGSYSISKPKGAKPFWTARRQTGLKMFLLVLPMLALVFVFSYLPLLGWCYAFADYVPGRSISALDYVGLTYFKMMFSGVGYFPTVMRNTLVLSLAGILLSPLPAILAIMVTQLSGGWTGRFQKTIQTATSLPNFISWVLVYSFAYALFNTNNGFLNQLLIRLGVMDRPINFLADPSHTWLKMCAWNVWKTLGWSSIMYLAAIAGIDQTLYEAAKIDGAGRFQIMWHITVPGILETYFVLLLLSIANFISNGMEQYFVFQNAMNRNKIEVLDLYVYNIGLGGGSFSYATAVSILKSVVSLTLLFVANNLSRLVRGNTIL